MSGLAEKIAKLLEEEQKQERDQDVVDRLERIEQRLNSGQMTDEQGLAWLGTKLESEADELLAGEQPDEEQDEEEVAEDEQPDEESDEEPQLTYEGRWRPKRTIGARLYHGPDEPATVHYLDENGAVQERPGRRPGQPYAVEWEQIEDEGETDAA